MVNQLLHIQTKTNYPEPPKYAYIQNSITQIPQTKWEISTFHI